MVPVNNFFFLYFQIVVGHGGGWLLSITSSVCISRVLRAMGEDGSCPSCSLPVYQAEAITAGQYRKSGHDRLKKRTSQICTKF